MPKNQKICVVTWLLIVETWKDLCKVLQFFSKNCIYLGFPFTAWFPWESKLPSLSLTGLLLLPLAGTTFMSLSRFFFGSVKWSFFCLLFQDLSSSGQEDGSVWPSKVSSLSFFTILIRSRGWLKCNYDLNTIMLNQYRQIFTLNCNVMDVDVYVPLSITNEY